MSSKMPPLLILAGGLGTRLGDIATVMPKAMMNIGGEPFIAYQLRLVRRNGFDKVVLCISHLAEQIVDFVGDGCAFGLRVEYSYDGYTRLGTGGAVKKACSIASASHDHFAVIYGDTYLDVDYEQIFEHFLLCKRFGLMTVIRNENQWDLSNAVFSGGEITAYDKEHQLPQMNYIDYGLSFFSTKPFLDCRLIDFDLGYMFKLLIAQKQLAGYEVSTRFYEIGSASTLSETAHYLLSKEKSES